MKRALFWLYVLAFYALCQLISWGYIFTKYVPERMGMIIGEGMIFLAIFIMAVIRLKNHLERERNYQQQQQNFLLSVTHELKSPLASVKLYLQTILKRDLDREQQQVFLGNSLKDIERLDYLVENVLLATKLESRTFSFPKENFELTEIVNNVVDRLQKNACKSQQAIVATVEPNLMIYADKFAITNVVSNLVENAIKYSPPCAHINVILEKREEGIVFEVADFGEGISDTEKKLIFNKFYRVGNEATRKTKGTGLGLYIVKSVLQKHEASIRVKDNIPNGSVFEVNFGNYAS
ncbi:HAMP domain-containing histidine kinase [Sphingobacterium sp. lm-10]|uniref:sensor histidine kinase n=1 Tax=Sphingobacterium sp. lm-10 TaxID=2944904 RepID=UPI0020228A44|nr:HAMP domain-containing sensor histidine kinase [Sphingobacterium sp. lm-10]MCL7988019.1 HAMP domain-containing histidine kinase [Sphingobacterium sp. lm-10]